VEIKAQDFIGLVEDKVVVASRDLEAVIEALAGRMLAGRQETLMALVGDDDDAGRAVEALERVSAKYPGVEVDVHEGGQPFYPLLLSAE